MVTSIGSTPDNHTTLKLDRVPYHVAIIMDGNGRWATQRGMPRLAGHKAGVDSLRRVLRASTEFGIKMLTIYAFSTENWGRPESEVKGLMNILDTVIEHELDNLDDNGVQLRHLGRSEEIKPSLLKKINSACHRLRNNDRLVLNVAFNYGGREEILHAVRRIVQDGIPAEQIDDVLLSYYLYTAGAPDPDLIVRTSGELRVSNFLMWQGAYAEYYATPSFWPDFDREELRKALLHYASRERRYGLTTPPA